MRGLIIITGLIRVMFQGRQHKIRQIFINMETTLPEALLTSLNSSCTVPASATDSFLMDPSLSRRDMPNSRLTTGAGTPDVVSKAGSRCLASSTLCVGGGEKCMVHKLC